MKSHLPHSAILNVFEAIREFTHKEQRHLEAATQSFNQRNKSYMSVSLSRFGLGSRMMETLNLKRLSL